MKPIDYSQTIMYRIICKDLSITNCYVGHTTNFTNRKSHHKDRCIYQIEKAHNSKIYQIIRNNGGWDNWEMLEIEKFPCQNGNEARTRERYWYEFYEANMNSNKPIAFLNEYYHENKKQILAYHKNYYILNTNKILQYQSEYSVKNKEKLKQRAKEYYQKNKEKIKQRAKEYYQKNNIIT